MEEDKGKSNLVLLDFTKDRKKVETVDPEGMTMHEYYMDLYIKCYAAFQYIESDNNYAMAVLSLRQSFQSALATNSLDTLEEAVDEFLGDEDPDSED